MYDGKSLILAKKARTGGPTSTGARGRWAISMTDTEIDTEINTHWWASCFAEPALRYATQAKSFAEQEPPVPHGTWRGRGRGGGGVGVCGGRGAV